jgi:carboxypeptidase D
MFAEYIVILADDQLTLAAKGLLATNLLPNFKLAGVAIGNGWIDGFEQYPAYVDFAYEKGLIKKDSAVRC